VKNCLRGAKFFSRYQYDPFVDDEPVPVDPF